MSRRRVRAVRQAPALRLLEHGHGGAPPGAALRLPARALQPVGVLRLGPSDLEPGLAAARAGALPSAVLTGMGEHKKTAAAARRGLGALELPWLLEPLLWKTALPGYRTSQVLQSVDYTPGRDEEPYSRRDFADHDLLRRVARAVVGSQLDLGAGAVMTGCFVAEAPEDEWLTVTGKLIEVGVSARDTMAPVPTVATVGLSMRGFDDVEAQRRVVDAVGNRGVDAYLLMLDGVSENSTAERLAAAIRVGVLLKATGARVIMGRAGDLRPLFVACGLDVEYGLGRLLRFHLPDYDRSGGPGPTVPRFECPSLVASLNESVALAALRGELIEEAECRCASCADAVNVADQLKATPEHDAHTVVGQLRHAGSQSLDERAADLDRMLRSGVYNWATLVERSVVERVPARLDRYRRALDQVAKWGLLDDGKLAGQLQL